MQPAGLQCGIAKSIELSDRKASIGIQTILRKAAESKRCLPTKFQWVRRKLKLVRNLSGNNVCSVILPGLRRDWGLNDHIAHTFYWAACSRILSAKQAGPPTRNTFGL